MTRRCVWCSDELKAEDLTTSVATGLEFCGANPHESWHEPEVLCVSCWDYGFIEIRHPSTDGLWRIDPCPDLDNPQRHPPAPPVPVSLVKPHDCNGVCCPPF